MLRKLVLVVISAVVLIGAGVYAAFKLSPWPSALLIRHSFEESSEEDAIAATLPKGVSAQRGLSYDPGDRDALFDLFVPSNAHAALPAVIWLHGGGFVANSRSVLSWYLPVLAARGYATIAIDYSRAPEARFPTPVRQTDAALTYLVANAERFNIDRERIFLAGDSAGAQIAAQTALIISDPSYARQMAIAPRMARAPLRGVVLFCGLYDPPSLNFETSFGRLMRTVIWAYLGTRDPHDPRVRELSVTPQVTAAYPPVFISVGNADSLAPQSVAFAEALHVKGVEVDALFFPQNHDPPLAHEYQLALSTDAGRLAFDRMVAFLTAHSK